MTDLPHGAGDRLLILRPTKVTSDEFIEYWASQYDYGDEARYDNNIHPPLNCEALRGLFSWKIGPRFRESHAPVVEKHFISRTEEMRAMCANEGVTAQQLLEAFQDSGAIYRIFWIHCWFPQRFPIYDQHVHRAMTFLRDGAGQELDRYGDPRKIRLYLDEFLPFWQSFTVRDYRVLDRALWAFGKFLKAKENLLVEGES